MVQKFLVAPDGDLVQTRDDYGLIAILGAWSISYGTIVNILIRIEIYCLGPRIVSEELKSSRKSLFHLCLQGFIVAAGIVSGIASTLRPAELIEERLSLIRGKPLIIPVQSYI